MRNKLVAVQRPGGSTNAIGERVTTWTTVATMLASIEAINGREALIAAERQAETSHTIRIPHSFAVASIAANWRVLWGQRFTADATSNTLTVTGPRAWAVNDVVRVATYGGTLPAPLAEGATYYVKTASAGVYTLALTEGGAAIDLTTAGSGYNVFQPRVFVLDQPPRNVGERDVEFELICSEGLRHE